MHNLHIGRVNADTHEEASEIVEERLSTWGDDDNWFSICGSFCKEDLTFSDEFDEDWLEKEEILNNPHCFDDMLDSDDLASEGKEIIEKGIENATGDDLLWVSKYYRNLWHLSKLTNPNQLDVWKDEFKGGCFDEYGLTDFGSEGENTYLVLIDMHS